MAKRFLVLIGILAGTFGALAGAGMAAEEDVFVVPRVPTQAQADNARQAKAIAQGQGRRRAMDILLRRLTPEDHWIYLPKLSQGQDAEAGAELYGADGGLGKAPISLSSTDLERLESGFEVYDEKSSSSFYRAFITYRFKPNAVRQLLKDARIPYSEAQTRTALVLPVLQTDSGVYLWESNNPWMAAWKSRPYTHELTPMAPPLGDLEDSAIVSARKALALDPESLRAVAEHYSVSQVIVAHARLRQREGRDELSVRLINGYRDDGGASTLEELGADEEFSDEVDAAVERFAPEGAQVDDFAAEPGDVLGSVFITEEMGNFPTLAERAIEATIASYASGWKQRTLIDHAAESVLVASAFFNSISDWSRIRSALIATPLVGSVQVLALSKRGAEMRIRSFGDPSKLQVALENQGLVLWTETGERWFVATPSAASQLRGQRFLRSRRRGLFGEDRSTEDIRPLPTEYEQQDQKIERRY